MGLGLEADEDIGAWSGLGRGSGFGLELEADEDIGAWSGLGRG